MIPDLDGPVGAAGGEHARVEVIPLDGVHRHVVSVVRLQQLLGVGFGALGEQVDVAQVVLFVGASVTLTVSRCQVGAAQTRGFFPQKTGWNFCKLALSYATPSLSSAERCGTLTAGRVATAVVLTD